MLIKIDNVDFTLFFNKNNIKARFLSSKVGGSSFNNRGNDDDDNDNFRKKNDFLNDKNIDYKGKGKAKKDSDSTEKDQDPLLAEARQLEEDDINSDDSIIDRNDDLFHESAPSSLGSSLTNPYRTDNIASMQEIIARRTAKLADYERRQAALEIVSGIRRNPMNSSQRLSFPTSSSSASSSSSSTIVESVSDAEPVPTLLQQPVSNEAAYAFLEQHRDLIGDITQDIRQRHAEGTELNNAARAGFHEVREGATSLLTDIRSWMRGGLNMEAVREILAYLRNHPLLSFLGAGLLTFIVIFCVLVYNGRISFSSVSSFFRQVVVPIVTVRQPVRPRPTVTPPVPGENRRIYDILNNPSVQNAPAAGFIFAAAASLLLKVFRRGK